MEFPDNFGLVITIVLSAVTLISVIFTPVMQISRQVGVIQTEITHLKEGQIKLEEKIQGFVI